MPNGMHFNFMRLILDTLRTYSTQVTAYDAALLQMELALQAEGRSIGIQRGSEYTPVLKGALAACESLYTHLRQLVSGYAGLSHRNEYQGGSIRICKLCLCAVRLTESGSTVRKWVVCQCF